MDDVKAIIKQRVREKEQKKKAQVSLFVVFLASSFVMFLMLTAAYMRKYNPDFKLNSSFTMSTGVLLLSSICTQISLFLYKKDELHKGFIFLMLAGLLTVAFAALQLRGWQLLRIAYVKDNVLFNSYMTFIMLSIFHLLHVLGGLIYTAVLTKKHFTYQIHSRNISPIKFAVYYGHFLSAVWVILFIIFI